MNSKIRDNIQRIKAPFYQGLSKKAVINAVVSSLILTVFPVFGTVTILLTLVALRFKLNLPLMIVISYIATPLQFLLFLPFISLGETVLGAPHSDLDFEQIQASFNHSVWNTIVNLFSTLLYGIGGWLVFVLPIGLVTYFLGVKS
jgi:uncharacterized protein (DUF2062 family)